MTENHGVGSSILPLATSLRSPGTFASFVPRRPLTTVHVARLRENFDND